ncbi:MAG: sigma-70 family RNA polymerase sigma factor [Nitrospira sp.]|jgi:RNA polymerase sigma-70 factor (ECF subfamily)|nr:MAG: sigma-70 family RNA polymerase sigma factor [Nitrospira sp.]
MRSTHPQDDADPALLADITAGNQTAFERLYRLYETRVFQYISTLVSNSALAEEVVGDTMMAVWRGAGTFSGTSRVSTWIFGIARHKALDALRRTGRAQREVNLDGAADLVSSADSPFDQMQRSQTESLTKQALSTLSRDHQEILRLVFYEELPYEDIAALLSIPTNTVKTRVFYAKQQLKRHLERLGQKEPIR